MQIEERKRTKGGSVLGGIGAGLSKLIAPRTSWMSWGMLAGLVLHGPRQCRTRAIPRG